MIWQPEAHLAAFKAWASRFPVREPNGNPKAEIRKARLEADEISRLRANGSKNAQKARKAKFEAELTAMGETRQQRRNRKDRERRARRNANS